MDEAGWLTVTEIARRLDRPPSTVSYWRNTFRELLDERVGDDEHPTYRFDVFEQLGRLMRNRTAHGEIRRVLEQHRADGAGAQLPVPVDQAILDELRGIREALRDLPAIRASLERLADRDH